MAILIEPRFFLVSAGGLDSAVLPLRTATQEEVPVVEFKMRITRTRPEMLDVMPVAEFKVDTATAIDALTAPHEFVKSGGRFSMKAAMPSL